MRQIFAWMILALAANGVRGQEFHIPLYGAEILPSSGPLLFTLPSAIDGGLPVETEYAIQTPSIQSALELTEEQLERIRKEIQSVNGEYQPKYELAAASTDDNDEKCKMIEVLHTNQRTSIEVLVDKILLPHQSFRLKQLQNRGRLQASFNSSEYTGFQELLNLTSDQKKKLAEKSAEMREELKIEVQELKQKRSQEVLESVLTDEQRAKLKDVLGDPVSRIKKH